MAFVVATLAEEVASVQAELRKATAVTITYSVRDAASRKSTKITDPAEVKAFLGALEVVGAMKGMQAGHTSVVTVELTLADGSRAVLDFLEPTIIDRSHWGQVTVAKTFYERVKSACSKAEGRAVDPLVEADEARKARDGSR